MALINNGNKLVQENRMQEAKKFFIRAIQLKSDRPEGYEGLGLILQYQKEYESSILELEKALKFDSTNSRAIYGVTLSLWALGRYAEALKKCVYFIKIEPSNYRGYWVMAQVLLDLRRYEDALEICEEGIQLFPQHSDFYKFKAEGLAFLGKFQEAVKFLQKATTLDPYNGSYYLFWAGMLQFNIKDYFDAREKYRKALEAYKRKADPEGIRDAKKGIDEIDSLIKKQLKISIFNSLNIDKKMTALISSFKTV